MTIQQASPNTTSPHRAQRYSLEIPIRYRKQGEAVWHSGTTKNISRSGVLFLGEKLMEENTTLDLSFTLPGEMHGEGGGTVVCEGRVVRTVFSPRLHGWGSMAAGITGYRLVRHSAAGGTG